ncbi:MAG: hypothetical protein S0880_11745 [Actinomycetota bacterium]|nr:hypothetical protein [Actinomycetota bacterium]
MTTIVRTDDAARTATRVEGDDAQHLRMSTIDRQFLGQSTLGVMDNVDAPSMGDLRGTLARLHRIQPEHPFFRRIDRTGDVPRWSLVSGRDLEAHLHEVVVESSIPSDESIERVCDTVVHERMGDLPLKVRWSGERLTSTFDHGLGDARILCWLYASLVLAARHRDPTMLIQSRGVRAPLARAFAHHFGRRPARVVDVVRQPRPAPGWLDPDGAPYDVNDVFSVFAVMSAETGAELRRWRDQAAPGAGIGAVLGSAFARAVTGQGIELVSPGVNVLLDARRYLPTGTVVNEGFVTSTYVEPDDLFDPRQLSRATAQALESGRPLAGMGASYARSMLPGGRGESVPEGRASRPIARLSVSHVQKPPLYDLLPWIGGPSKARYGPVSPSYGTIGLGLVTLEIGGRTHLGVMGRSPAHPRAACRTIVDSLAADPVGVLRG